MGLRRGNGLVAHSVAEAPRPAPIAGGGAEARVDLLHWLAQEGWTARTEVVWVNRRSSVSVVIQPDDSLQVFTSPSLLPGGRASAIAVLVPQVPARAAYAFLRALP